MPSFATMEARIIAELQRSDLATFVDDAINDAINHYTRYRFWFNETSATQNTASGTAVYAWPTDFVMLDSLVITVSGTTYPLRQVSPREIDEWNSTTSTGVPTCFAEYKSQFRLYPTPNATLTLTQYYVKSFTALTTGSASSNVWTTEAEELIRTRAKKLLAGMYLNDLNLASYLDTHERDLFDGLQRQTIQSTSAHKLRSWDA